MQPLTLYPNQSLPILINVPECEVTNLAWVSGFSRDIREQVGQAGVVLLRGLKLTGAEDFKSVCSAIEPDLRDYTGGDSPRTGVMDKVYTSTEYEPSLEVFLHNELSYAGWSPALVFFGCVIPALSGGQTPVADGRQIYNALPREIVARFEQRGIAYLQHLWDADGEPGIGKSWQETFETKHRNEAEQYLRNSGMTWQWTDFGIRTRAVHPAVIDHPVSAERCWRNQADQWHRELAGVKLSFGGGLDARFDPSTAGEETLGNHVTYADGGQIDVNDLKIIRQVAQSNEVLFPWQTGDIMIIDNILAMHGRKPFGGPRQILVAMA